MLCSQGLKDSQTSQSMCRSKDREEIFKQLFGNSDFGHGQEQQFEHCVRYASTSFSALDEEEMDRGGRGLVTYG